MACPAMEAGAAMTPDIDIWRCVNVIKKRYGGCRPLGRSHSGSCLEKADMDGCAVRTCTVMTVEKIERTEKKVGAPLN